MTDLSFVSTRDVTLYSPDFAFVFLIWSHAKHWSYFKLSLDILLILKLDVAMPSGVSLETLSPKTASS